MEILAAIGVTAIIGMSALFIFKTINFVTDLQDSVKSFDIETRSLKADTYNLYKALRQCEGKIMDLEERLESLQGKNYG